jgi:hypothetical protein
MKKRITSDIYLAITTGEHTSIGHVCKEKKKKNRERDNKHMQT